MALDLFVLAEHVSRVGYPVPPELSAHNTPDESLEEKTFRLTSAWLSSWEYLDQVLRGAVVDFLKVEDERAAIGVLAQDAVDRACQGGRR